MTDHSDVRDFVRYRDAGDPEALARVFDRTAPRLLLVAMHLTHDADAAEDLLQNTFVQAMQSAADFDTTRSLMPWLLGILTHRAADLQRGSQRAERHLEVMQEICADTGTPPDPATLVADREVAAEVSQAIESLPRSYRQVLLLHLVHGLRAVDIAHAQGMSQGTVRSQIRRGLTLLRRRLPVGLTAPAITVLLSEECVAAARIKVLATAGEIVGPVPALVPGRGLPRGWSPRAVAGAGLLLVAVVVGWFALDWGTPAAVDSRGEPAAAVVAADPGRPVVDRSPVPAAVVSAPVGVPEPALQAPRTWRVLWRADGRPAAGVAVCIRSPLRVSSVEVPIYRTADADGVIDTAGLPAGEYFLHRAGGDKCTARIGEAATLLLEPGFAVDGRVVDEHDVPLAGAEVWLSYDFNPAHGRVVGRADAAGQFVLPQVARGQHIAAVAPGRAWSPRYQVNAPDGARRGLTVRLPHRARAIETEVCDDAGAPVADAWVWVECGTPIGQSEHPDGPYSLMPAPQQGRTDAHGRLRVTGLRPGVYEVCARHDGRGLAPARRLLKLDATDSTPVRLVLESGFSVRGVVHDAAGRPVAGAPVIGGTLLVLLGRLTHTDAAGRFRLDGLSPRGVVLHTYSSRVGRARRPARAAAGDVLELERPLVLDPGRLLSGRVLGADGRPVVGAHLKVLSGGRWTGAGRVDADGNFKICNVVRNPPYEIQVFTPGHRAPVLLRGDLQPGPLGDLRLVAAPESASLRGKVVTPSGAAPANAVVHIGSHDSTWKTFVPIDQATGRFVVPHIPPGRVFVDVVSPDHPVLRHPEDLQLSGGAVRDLGVLQLGAGGHLHIRVDLAAPGLRVWVADAGGRRQRQLQRSRIGFRTATALIPGRYVVHVVADGVAERQLTVQIQAGVMVRRDVSLDRDR